MMRGILVFVFFCLFSFLNATNKPTTLTLAHEDKNAFPWVFPVDNGYQGLDLEFLKLLEKKLGITIKTVAFPWARCLTEMQQGNVDGAFASSYKKEREENGIYPTTADGKIDESKMIHISGYSLYIPANSNIDYDGKEFKNLNGPIGVQRGFSIVADIEKLGLKYDDGTHDPEVILKKLEAGRIAAAALQTARADDILKKNPSLASKIKKHPATTGIFAQKPYYIQLSHQLKAKYPDFINQFYKAVEEVRNSQEYKKIEENFYKKY